MIIECDKLKVLLEFKAKKKDEKVLRGKVLLKLKNKGRRDGVEAS